MTRNEIRTTVRKTLSQLSGCCLDNEAEVAKIVSALVRALYRPFCARCAHLDEVHVRGGCLGGPEANCDCKGFKEN